MDFSGTVLGWIDDGNDLPQDKPVTQLRSFEELPGIVLGTFRESTAFEKPTGCSGEVWSKTINVALVRATKKRPP